jgi:hypothetical protein
MEGSGRQVVAHHVRELQKLGLFRLAGTRPVRAEAGVRTPQGVAPSRHFGDTCLDVCGAASAETND